MDGIGTGSERLDRWLSQRGQGSAAALAERIIVTQETIYRWRHGKSLPGYRSRLDLERETGIPVESWSEVTP